MKSLLFYSTTLVISSMGTLLCTAITGIKMLTDKLPIGTAILIFIFMGCVSAFLSFENRKAGTRYKKLFTEYKEIRNKSCI